MRRHFVALSCLPETSESRAWHGDGDILSNSILFVVLCFDAHQHHEQLALLNTHAHVDTQFDVCGETQETNKELMAFEELGGVHVK